MSDFPFNENVSLLYLEHVPGDVPEIGGMYATWSGEPGETVQLQELGSGIQKWLIVPKPSGGYAIECNIRPPVGLPVAWNNEGPEAGTPIRVYAPNDASLYDVNIDDRHGNGWIISISPRDDYAVPGQQRFAGASGETVEIRAVGFFNPPPPHPGWFVSRV